MKPNEQPHALSVALWTNRELKFFGRNKAREDWRKGRVEKRLH